MANDLKLKDMVEYRVYEDTLDVFWCIAPNKKVYFALFSGDLWKLYSGNSDYIELKSDIYAGRALDPFYNSLQSKFSDGPPTSHRNCICTHSNKKIVRLMTSAYWFCPDCKADLGDYKA